MPPISSPLQQCPSDPSPLVSSSAPPPSPFSARPPPSHLLPLLRHVLSPIAPPASRHHPLRPPVPPSLSAPFGKTGPNGGPWLNKGPSFGQIWSNEGLLFGQTGPNGGLFYLIMFGRTMPKGRGRWRLKRTVLGSWRTPKESRCRGAVLGKGKEMRGRGTVPERGWCRRGDV